MFILPVPRSSQNHAKPFISRLFMFFYHKKPKSRKKFFFTFLPIWSSYLYPEVAKTTLNHLFHVYSRLSIIKSQKIEKNFFSPFYQFGHPNCARKWPKPHLTIYFTFIHVFLSLKAKKSKRYFFHYFHLFLPIWSSYLYPEVAKTFPDLFFHVY